jgi:hypothetical protein
MEVSDVMSERQISDASMTHFQALDRAAQEAAVRCLAALGHSEHTIARATRLSVEMIQRVLAVRS